MANAKKCDRCGCYYEDSNTELLKIHARRKIFIGIKDATRHLDGAFDKQDLCYNCSSELINWFEHVAIDY